MSEGAVSGFSPAASETKAAASNKTDTNGMCTLPNTPHETAADSANPKTTRQHPNFGEQTIVATTGNFPSLGSTMGPFFCLGTLGKGTFCSIHRCINLQYFHHPSGERHRTAAAKVETREFRNSGGYMTFTDLGVLQSSPSNL